MTKKDTKQFIAEANAMHKNIYSYEESIYLGALHKIKITCKIHGIFEQAASRHLIGAGCPTCAIEDRTLSTDEFIHKASLIHKDKYDYHKTQYVNSKTKVTIICKVHGEFSQNPSGHLSGSGCRACSRATTLDDFIRKAQKIHNTRYDYSSAVYVGTNIPLKIICSIHGQFYQTPNAHLAGSGCQRCARPSLINTTEKFIEKATQVHNGKYDYSNSVYTTCYAKVQIKCQEHGIFYQSASNHIRGAGCPICRASRGELSILSYLSIHNIQCHREKSFDGLINPITRARLWFDFYLPELNTLIEFDGKQHFLPVAFDSDTSAETKQANLAGTKYRDQIKNEYATNNNIKLIRIPYTQINHISDILDNELGILKV